MGLQPDIKLLIINHNLLLDTSQASKMQHYTLKALAISKILNFYLFSC